MIMTVLATILSVLLCLITLIASIYLIGIVVSLTLVIRDIWRERQYEIKKKVKTTYWKGE